MLKGEPEEKAEQFALRVKDITVFLDQLGIETPPALARLLKSPIGMHAIFAMPSVLKITPRSYLHRFQT